MSMPFCTCYSRWRGVPRCTIGLVGFLGFVGCSHRPPRVEAPPWNPSALAQRVLEQLDKNGDEAVDAQELAAAPGLAAGVRFIDADKDGRLSA
jgi:hypothetical protein